LFAKKSSNKLAAEGAQSVKPLRTFDEADDYVYDVRWSPVHPSVFATVNGEGYFDVWNLNMETEVRIIFFFYFFLFFTCGFFLIFHVCFADAGRVHGCGQRESDKPS
jgi:WD40 repeat protein